MATVEFGVNNALSNELWEKQLNVEVIEATYFHRFVGTSSMSLIQEKEEPNKSAGDRVTCGLRGILTARGKVGNEVLEGDEEAFTTADDQLFVDELRHAVSIPAGGTIDAQRVPYNLRAEGYDAMKQWYAERIDTAMFNQLCGFTTETDVAFSGQQAVLAPSANNIIRPGGVANDQSIGASAFLTLSMIDVLKERAATMRQQFGQPIIRPIMMNGQAYYVLFIHDFQETSLRQDAGANGWSTIYNNAIAGGQITNNPIFTGALGMYNNVILHKATRVTQGVNSATGVAVPGVRRAVFCGAQAAWVAWGQSYGQSAFRWVERLTDFQKSLGIAASSVWGLKKSRFSSNDFATIVLPTAAPAGTI
ncbi:N4-gp56 family major capsid protein [bacterium]|nr:N4-gp56 family major capsid protein [bacterium]